MRPFFFARTILIICFALCLMTSVSKLCYIILIVADNMHSCKLLLQYIDVDISIQHKGIEENSVIYSK